jgi:hypothetical protein
MADTLVYRRADTLRKVAYTPPKSVSTRLQTMTRDYLQGFRPQVSLCCQTQSMFPTCDKANVELQYMVIISPYVNGEG